jgi:hypothetical protein
LPLRRVNPNHWKNLGVRPPYAFAHRNEGNKVRRWIVGGRSWESPAVPANNRRPGTRGAIEQFAKLPASEPDAYSPPTATTMAVLVDGIDHLASQIGRAWSSALSSAARAWRSTQRHAFAATAFGVQTKSPFLRDCGLAQLRFGLKEPVDFFLLDLNRALGLVIVFLGPN